MSYVFISYSRQDTDYVQSLAMALSKRGLNAWYDVGIEGGDSWWRKIAQKIEGCAAFVVVMTPPAEESNWVEREILLAEREGKPIIPMLLDGREFGMLINVQFYDVRGGKMPIEDAFDKLASFLPHEEAVGDTAVLDPAVMSAALAQTTGLDSLWYSKDHLWVRQLANEVATIGITEFGLQKMGTIVEIDLPKLDSNLRPGKLFATIETEKVMADLISPIAGAVTRINDDLKSQPELVNADPYGNGWLVQTRDTVIPSLMNAAEYEAYCKSV